MRLILSMLIFFQFASYTVVLASDNKISSSQNVPLNGQNINNICSSFHNIQDHTYLDNIKINNEYIHYTSDVGIYTYCKNIYNAGMSYVYYKKNDTVVRPIIFIYNGGPGSSSIWLHIGAFGPFRVKPDNRQSIDIIPNIYSLIDVADLVFVDAPGTGYGRINDDDSKKELYSVDGDAKAFSSFVYNFLGKYERLNSPIFLLGESYGTLRTSIMSYILGSEYHLTISGIVLISQLLNYDNSINRASRNPGMDLPYVLSLPSFAAVAWYHQREKREEINSVISQANDILDEYSTSLSKGNNISENEENKISKKLSYLIGLDENTIKSLNLRITGPEFERLLLRDHNLLLGRLDGRELGDTLTYDDNSFVYDPFISNISPLFVKSLNSIFEQRLHVTNDRYDSIWREYRLHSDAYQKWSYVHRQPNVLGPIIGAPNSLPDLAFAIKENPGMGIQLHQGYFDLDTPFSIGTWEINHLPIKKTERKNIEIHRYMSGHMIYLDRYEIEPLSKNIKDFILRYSH